MSIVDQVARIVKESMDASTTHDWSHVKRVYALTSLISEVEDADLEIAQLGALLHDIGRGIGEPHTITGKKRAREILTHLSYADNKIEIIEQIIENHDMETWSQLTSIEEQIVWDADKLDGLGAIGIARAFYMRGETGLPFHDFSWYDNDTKLRFMRLHTQTAKKLAASRMEFMDSFFARIKKESGS